MKTVGIIGGLGPPGTALFFHALVKAAIAHRVQHQLRILVDSDPSHPSPTRALVDQGLDPTASLVKAGRELIERGAEVLALPCNAGHAYERQIRAGLDAIFVSIVAEGASAVAQVAPGGRVGVLGTKGTIGAGLYQKALAERGALAVLPGMALQDRVSEVVRGVLDGADDGQCRIGLLDVVADLNAQGAAAILVACTELGGLISMEDTGCPVVDSSAALASAVVRAARS
jgi:aspartate racemase